MDWKPDRKAKKAIYKQLAEYIENGIADGTFPPDKPLPSERYLAKELNINRSTVVAAYDELSQTDSFKEIEVAERLSVKIYGELPRNVFQPGIDILRRDLFCLIYPLPKGYEKKRLNIN